MKMKNILRRHTLFLRKALKKKFLKSLCEHAVASYVRLEWCWRNACSVLVDGLGRLWCNKPVRLSRTPMNFRPFFMVDLNSQRNLKTNNQHQLRQRRLEEQPTTWKKKKSFLWNATDTYSHFLNFYYFKFNDFYGSFVRSAHSSNAFKIGWVQERAAIQLITLSESEQQHRSITHTWVSCCCFYAYLFSFSIDLIKTYFFFWWKFIRHLDRVFCLWTKGP